MLKLSFGWKVALGFILTVVITAGCVFGGIWVTHTQNAKLGNARARCQTKPRMKHTVIISGGKVVPQFTSAKTCDTLTITNQDNQARIIAFGPHDHHIAYDGVSERFLNRGQSLSITLIQPGNYLFHDHEDPNVFGTFTVTGTPGRN